MVPAIVNEAINLETVMLRVRDMFISGFYSANKSCDKHDPPTAKVPEVIYNEPNVFNSRHKANVSIIFRDQKEKVINKFPS